MTISKSLKGGRKKRGNGHKMNCGCPICKNMRKSKKKGGYNIDNFDNEEEKNNDDVGVEEDDEYNVNNFDNEEEKNNDDDNGVEEVEDEIDHEPIEEETYGAISGGKKTRRKGRKTKRRSSRKGRKTKRMSSRRR